MAAWNPVRTRTATGLSALVLAAATTAGLPLVAMGETCMAATGGTTCTAGDGTQANATSTGSGGPAAGASSTAPGRAASGAASDSPTPGGPGSASASATTYTPATGTTPADAASGSASSASGADVDPGGTRLVALTKK